MDLKGTIKEEPGASCSCSYSCTEKTPGMDFKILCISDEIAQKHY